MFDSSRVFAYTYSDPLLESMPNVSLWEWPIAQIYQDQGDRQQLERLLENCQAEPYATLLVRCLEELGDSLAAIGSCLTQLEALNISIILIGNPPIPFPSAELLSAERTGEPTRYRSDLLKLLQTSQTYHRRQQLQHSHALNRIQALPPPGRAPYGYRRGKDRYTLDRSAAPVVKDFFDHFLLYGSLRSSVRYLHKKYSKKISVSTGKRWLTSPVYRGDLSYHTGEVVSDTHVPIVSRDEAAQVDRLLRRNRRMSPRTASAPRSLSGLVGCGNCESAMKISQVKAQPQDYLYLRPVACPQQPRCRALPYRQVLEKTIQQICQDLAPAINAAPIPNIEGIQQGLSAQIAAKQSVLEQLPGLVEIGILDAETATLRAYKVRTEIAALQTSLAQLPPANLKSIAQLASIPQFWLDLSEVERRFYFREFIRHIQIVHQETSWSVRLQFIF